MKKITLAIVALTMAGGLYAQDSGFSLGVDLAMPVGEFGDFTSFGAGPVLSIEKEMRIITGLSGASIAPLFMTPKQSDIVKSYMLLPFTAHYKYFFDDVREGIYAGLHLGFGLGLVKYKEVTVGGVSIGGKDRDTQGFFIVAPTVGYVINERIDVGLRFQIMPSLDEAESDLEGNKIKRKPSNFVGLRLAYNF